MSWKSSANQYGSVAVALHWVSAAAILGLFALGFLAANTDDPALKAGLLRGHVPLGILALVLTLFRIGWWAFDRRPAQLLGMPSWQALSERVVRVLLYFLIVVMGASGIGLLVLSGAGAILFFGAPGPLPDFWTYPPMFAHFAGAFALLALAGLHIVAALYHQFYKRDRLLARMWTRPLEATQDRAI
jgi:cytochrome b561